MIFILSKRNASNVTPDDVMQTDDAVMLPEFVDLSRKANYRAKFESSTISFEDQCNRLSHKLCSGCHMISLQNIFKTDDLCKSCFGKNEWTKKKTAMLPVWFDFSGDTQYHVPYVLASLREGEKLLIQQISVYVPLHHLMFGQLGAKGHIVSFPQNVAEVCKVLPRLPAQVSLIRVVKHFKLPDGEITSKTFSIRKQNVLDALKWLKQFNHLYHAIQIADCNLDWIEDGVEQQLPPTVEQLIQDMSTLQVCSEDRGPSEDQISAVVDVNSDIEPCYGTLNEFNQHIPKVKDSEVVAGMVDAMNIGKHGAARSNKGTISFPYVSPDPVSEYTEIYLFEKAFPCLFPGGTGGYGSIPKPKPTLSDWMSKTMLFKDGRFGGDRMWAFCALNFLSRHTNQTSGGFFVDTFYKQGPKTLEALQKEVSNGNSGWISSISYFSLRVTGSTQYWQDRQNEVFAWINYHLEQQHGPPSFFITLSCAEYHWKDITRLIADRCEKGGLPIPDFTKEGRVALINSHTIVVQEYFQQRVQIWLNTVGRDLLHIKYHWLRFEFAPSRGQIHTHLLAICDNLEMLCKCNQLKEDRTQLAWYLSSWLDDTLGMTANCSAQFVDEIKNSESITHPSTVNFRDIPVTESELDTTNCQVKFQSHKCSAYCMRKRKQTKKTETAFERLCRVCRCGAGVEATASKCDTPGFPLRVVPAVMRDLRGFDRVDLPRNNKRITQSSTYLMRGWRGNCDIQLLIYKSSPFEVDASDVSRVTNYVVSYACKGNESIVEEKKSMEGIVLAAKDENGDARDVKRIARRLLNECTKNRVVSRQEAVCQLIGLPLYTCSETFERVSLSGNIRLGTEQQSKYTFLARYAKRGDDLAELSLDQFFHKCFNANPSSNRGDKRFKIPIYSGAQCEAVFPVTAAYAQGVLLIHSPWRHAYKKETNEEILKRQFEVFVASSACPESVKVAFERAKMFKGVKPPTASGNDLDYNTFSVRPDQDIIDLVDLAGTIFKNIDDIPDSSEMNYDYGVGHTWSTQAVKVR